MQELICPGHRDAEQFGFPLYFCYETSFGSYVKFVNKGMLLKLAGYICYYFGSIGVAAAHVSHAGGAWGWGWGSSQVPFILLLSIHGPDLAISPLQVQKII